MIENLIPYGGAIFWLLLFFGIYLITVSAEKREGFFYPAMWTALTAGFVFGFTNFSVDPVSAAMAVGAYTLLGFGFAVFKWVKLVQSIKRFIEGLSQVVHSDYTMRHLAHEAFQPMDAEDVMRLPPDPYEFRTRITLWFLYWPCFTVFRCLAYLHRKIARTVWRLFHNLSKRMYDRQNNSGWRLSKSELPE